MVDLRRIVIIFIIAVLTAVLVNAIVGMFLLKPDYNDYCKNRYYPEKPRNADIDRNFTCQKYETPSQKILDECAEQGGYPEYSYDENGCITSYSGCNTCQQDYEEARKHYNLGYFLISSVIAMIAIIIGLFLPAKEDINEWIATGLMFGGLIALFFGTFRYYEYLGRFIKPAVILTELLLIIYMSYKKLRR